MIKQIQKIFSFPRKSFVPHKFFSLTFPLKLGSALYDVPRKAHKLCITSDESGNPFHLDEVLPLDTGYPSKGSKFVCLFYFFLEFYFTHTKLVHNFGN